MSPDSQVLQSLISAFEGTISPRFTRLHIDVRSKIVTISGRVKSAAERQEAERIARSVVGSRALVMEVSIAPAAMVLPMPAKDAKVDAGEAAASQPA